MLNVDYIKGMLRAHGQEHLLSFYEELEETKKRALLHQIECIDFEEVKRAQESLNSLKCDRKRNFTSVPFESEGELSAALKKRYKERGLSLLKEGKVAVVLVAGGQGTRLGHKGPKGTVSIGESPSESLFALQANRLKKIVKETGTPLSWYIMTSPVNHRETMMFFENNLYFDYDSNHITFFTQGLMPTLNQEGKLMLESQSCVSMAPNGNGGVFGALKENGIISDLMRKGVEWVFFNNIDNALVKVADPLFIGFADVKDCELSSKSVKKKGPGEKVGVFCLSEGKPCVLEYSEMDEEVDEDERFTHANIGIHLFRRSFLEKTMDIHLPYHAAHKKISIIDSFGKPLSPLVPNGYKLETFYFDAFPFASGMSILEVEREREFAPVKNRVGEDSLESARILLQNEKTDCL